MRNTLRLTASFGKRLTVAAFSFFAFLSGSAVLMAEEAEGSGLNPLKTWRTDLALWTFVVFVLLLLVLWKFAFGPIAKGLETREQSVLDKISNAEKANADAKELLNLYQQKLSESAQEVRQIIDDARAEGDKKKEEILAEARAQAEEERQKALKEIAAASDTAQAELAAKSAELVTRLAGEILKKEIKPEDHADLLQGALNEISQS
jgi:F-type H+-transporting ATPase subunit b